jgi:hypothetical protein
MAPRDLGILQAALTGLQASGPSRMPTSFGQIMGQAGQAGIGAYHQAQQQQLGRAIQMETLRRQQAQLDETKRLHDAQIKRYEADAAKDGEAAARAKAEREYFARPDIQEMVRSGNIAGVMAGLPNMSAGALVNYGTLLQGQNKPPQSRTIRRGDQLVTQEYVGGEWIDIAQGPAFAKQVPGVHISAPQPPVAIVGDDGKPRYVTRAEAIGKTPWAGSTEAAAVKVGAKSQEEENKRRRNMAGLGDAIQQAEDLLDGVERMPDGTVKPRNKPTGSGVGTAVDTVAGVFGFSPAGSTEAQRLKAIGGALTSKMPRMEGPQSDKDTQLYKEMAAEVGNSNLPVARRKEALKVVKELWLKYEGPQTAPGASGAWEVVR